MKKSITINVEFIKMLQVLNGPHFLKDWVTSLLTAKVLMPDSTNMEPASIFTN